MLKYGSPPFLAKNIKQLFESIINDDVPWPHKIDEGVRKLLVGMLAKDPNKRWKLQQIYLASVPLAKAAAAAAAARSGIPPRPNKAPNGAGKGSSSQNITQNISVVDDDTDEYKQISVSASDIGMSINLSINRVYHDENDHHGSDHDENTGRNSGQNSDRQNNSSRKNSGRDSHRDRIQSNKVSKELSESEEMKRAGKFQKMHSKVALGDHGTGSTGSHGEKGGDGGKARAMLSGDDDDDDDFLDDDEDDDDYGGDSDRSVSSQSQRKPGSGSRRSRTGSGGSNSGRRKGGGGSGGGINRLDSEGFDNIMDTLAARPNGALGQSEKEKEKHNVLRYIDCLTEKGKNSFKCSENSHNPKLKLSASWYTLKGPRETQEDRVTSIVDLSAIRANVSSNTSSSLPPVSNYERASFFGMYDGHGGSGSSHLLQQRMHLVLTNDPHLLSNPVACLENCFTKVDKEICARLRSVDDESGSTGSVLLVIGQKITVANVGDSRCVMSRNGKAIELSSDHRLAIRPDERKRIEAAGGFCVADRVNGTLAITRSFGDLCHKETNERASSASTNKSASASSNTGGVIAVPEVTSETIGDKDEFAVLASDGLWDVMASQQVVNFVRQRISNHGDLERASKELTKEAVTKQRSVDNVSIVIVAFNQSNPSPSAPAPPVGRPSKGTQNK